MQYLIEYPMGKQRIETHLKQMILNTKYKYEDGRQSALELVYALIQKLPIPLLEEYTQIFFLPLVLQLVNDESKTCRETVSKCIMALLKRLSIHVLQSLHEYAVRWSSVEGPEGHQLRRTSIQLFGIFIEARLDFMKRADRLEEVVTYVQTCLDNEVRSSPDYTDVLHGKQWEVSYFCLQTLEKISKNNPKPLLKDTKLWENVIKSLVHPHPWIKLISSRIIHSQFSGESSDKYVTVDETKNASSIIMRIPGSLFDIIRNLCFQLNSEEEQHTEEISTLAIKNLSWAIKIMDAHPSLCYKEKDSPELAEDDDDDGREGQNHSSNPVTWLFTRLSHIAKKTGTKRRDAVFKCFAAFASVCDLEIISSNLELMLEPLNRAISEANHKEENSSRRRRQVTSDAPSEADLPKDVMQLLEEVCGTELFMNVLASTKSKAREKQEMRKQAYAAEAVHDPEAAAKRKIARHEKDKQRKKRRVQERKVNRGVFTKKPRHVS
jgi:U3 small nucleolar RNA-associated protein 20